MSEMSTNPKYKLGSSSTFSSHRRNAGLPQGAKEGVAQSEKSEPQSKLAMQILAMNDATVRGSDLSHTVCTYEYQYLIYLTIVLVSLLHSSFLSKEAASATRR
jgi:hypothetical protein